MEDRKEYIEFLKRQRDLEYPAEMKKLREKLEQLTKQTRDVTLDIEFLENQKAHKSIFDLPNLVWTKILENFCVLRQRDLLSMCLASPVFEQFITKENGVNKFKLLGESAFTILVQNCYLDIHDLGNSVESKSENLGMFAATSWCLLQPEPVFDHVKLTNWNELETLENDILLKQQENRIWAAFAGKCFSFECYHLGVKLMTFIEKYREYMLIIKFVDSSYQRFGIQQLRSILEGKLPNLQTFNVCYGDVQREAEEYDLGTVIDSATRRKMFALSTWSIPKGSKDRLTTLFAKIVRKWKSEAREQDQAKLQLEDIRELELRLGFGSATAKEIYMELNRTVNYDCRSTPKLKKIVGLGIWCSLRFASCEKSGGKPLLFILF